MQMLSLLAFFVWRILEADQLEIELFSCWAKKCTQTIKDVKDYRGIAFEDTINIVIRQIQKQAITNKMRVKWKGKKYNIVKINPDTAFLNFWNNNKISKLKIRTF